MNTIFLDIVQIEPGYYYDPETKEAARADDDQKWRIVNKDRAVLCKYGIEVMDASGATMIDPFETEEKCFEWIKKNIDKDGVYIDGRLAKHKKALEEKIMKKIPDNKIYNFRKIVELEKQLDGNIMTFSEAQKKWGLGKSTLREAQRNNRFKEGEVRKSGGTWLVTEAAMRRLYGEPKQGQG